MPSLPILPYRQSVAMTPNRTPHWLAPIVLILIVAAIYWPGVHGGFLFDDFANIVDNPALQIVKLDVPSLKAAALSSPSSELKRPLASLSFALNEYFTRLDPEPMKIVNIVIHLLNAALVYALALVLLRLRDARRDDNSAALSAHWHRFALVVVSAWALAPINLTPVLYVVQRMESLCNLFVLAGLLAYLHGRERQLDGGAGWLWIAGGLICGSGLGLLAKESALLLPLYAMLAEWALLRWRAQRATTARALRATHVGLVVLGIVAAIVLVPPFIDPNGWLFRPFTLSQRLLTEPRVLWSYIDWTLLPNLGKLGFYYDDYGLSKGFWSPPTTAFAIAGLCALAIAAIVLRRRMPMASLGLGWFLAGHAMTATVIPLELVFEHRNYFASFGLILAVCSAGEPLAMHRDMRRVVPVLAAAWIAWLGFVTALRVQEWKEPLRLTQSLVAKQPNSPRTQYELGRDYLLMSQYDPHSPFTPASQLVLAKAAALPDASPLAEQALLIQAAHLKVPENQAWWDSLDAKLRKRTPDAQAITALYGLTRCAIDGYCNYPRERMEAAYRAAMASLPPAPEVFAIHANYAVNVLHDPALAVTMARESVRIAPTVPKYRENLILLLAIDGKPDEARSGLRELATMIGNDDALAWAKSIVPAMVDSKKD